jgi:hypothetical protein
MNSVNTELTPQDIKKNKISDKNSTEYNCGHCKGKCIMDELPQPYISIIKYSK